MTDRPRVLVRADSGGGTSPDAELDGDRPIDVLFQRDDAVTRVVQAATHWSAALAA